MQQAPAKPGLGGGAGPRQPEASEQEGVDWETLGKADPLSALLGMGILDRVAYILGQMPTPQTVLPLLGLLRRCAGGGRSWRRPTGEVGCGAGQGGDRTLRWGGTQRGITGLERSAAEVRRSASRALGTGS